MGSGNEWFEKLKSNNATQSRIKRSSQMVFKCDITGKLFEGENAEQDYKDYMDHVDWHMPVPIEQVKEPKTMACMFQEYDEDNLEEIAAYEAAKKKQESMSASEIVESMLNETYEPASKQDDIKTVFVCPVCETRTRYEKLRGENSIPYNFETIENYDAHLWEVHKQAVKREGDEVTVELVDSETVSEA